MARSVQISAPVSKETKELLDQQSRASGLKKGHLIESALRYHLRALQELPAEAFIPARVVLTRTSFEEVAERLRSPGEPPQELRDLMRGPRD